MTALLARYHALGWHLIAVPAGRKGPIDAAWQTRDYSDAELRRGNVGVLLDGGLVDIDLDCAEALILADLYLPPTDAEFGRASKPRSHRLYIARGAAFEAFADPLLKQKNTLLELRAPGRDGGAHQTIVPPSVVDERREWVSDKIEPAVVDAAQLHRCCAYLAVACLVRRYVATETSERPGPDLPHILYRANPVLGRVAYAWLRIPDPLSPKPRRKPPRDYTRAEHDLAEITEAIPNDRDWHGWNRIGMAIFGASGGSAAGATIFHGWSGKSPKYDPSITSARWRHWHRSPPSRLGVGTLIFEARRAGRYPKQTRNNGR